MFKFKLLDQVIINGVDELLTIIQINGDQCTVCGTNSTTYVVLKKEMTYIRSAKLHDKNELLAMYILVRNSAPIGLGINSVGHVAHIAANNFDSELSKEWECKSFKLRTCLVTDAEYDLAINKIQELGTRQDDELSYVEFFENDWKDNPNKLNISVAFAPRYTWPSLFKLFDLHSGIKLTKETEY
ncbi:MAG: hypothetical protein M0R17_03590 [Candidatus Omnitrophica bacterium]|jgi:hypothetical protein|nr:hypothetical protein [Candidatus Omnitrophota bacterium]